MINVIIPSNKPSEGVPEPSTVDPILSGRYLVTELHHLVVPTDQRHHMAMTVSKDSLESAPPVKDLQYPNEPNGGTDIIGATNSNIKLVPRTKGIS